MSTTTLSGLEGGKATITLDLSGLEKLMAEAPARADAVVIRIAQKVQRSAQQNVSFFGAVDTGALMSSISTNTSKSDGYSEAASAASTKRPEATLVTLPSGSPGHAFVGPVVDYGIWVEFGAHNVQPKPFLTTAVENERAKFDDEFGEVFKT